MPDRDPYAVLGIELGATRIQIRRAYRRLAKRYHPDVNAGDAAAAERFKEMQRAYEALTDERRDRTSRPTGPAYGFAMPDEHPFLRYFLRYWELQAMRSSRATQPGAGGSSTESSP